jgi:hypothetical protein
MTDWHKLLVYYIDHVIAHESVSFIGSTLIGTKLLDELSEEEKAALRQAEDEARVLAQGYFKHTIVDPADR